MCFQDDAPDTKKDFTGDPVQERSLPGECCSSFHSSSHSSPLFFFHSLKKRRLLVCTWQPPTMWFRFQGTLWWEERLQESRHTVHEVIRLVVYSQEGFTFFFFFFFVLTYWPPAEMMSWSSNRPECFEGWGGWGLQGALGLLAVTSETTRHIRIRSI